MKKKMFVALVIIYALICGMSLGYGIPNTNNTSGVKTPAEKKLADINQK